MTEEEMTEEIETHEAFEDDPHLEGDDPDEDEGDDEDNDVEEPDEGEDEDEDDDDDADGDDEGALRNSALQRRLKRLKRTKSNFENRALDANIADLEKLIADTEKSVGEYVEAHPALAAEQARLEGFDANTKPDLERILQPDGVAAVEKTITDAITAIDEAEADVIRLKGKVPKGSKSTNADPWERGAVGDAASDLAEAEQKFAEAERTLTELRGLAKAVEARHKAMQGAEKEILKLGRSGQPATAYWLLTEDGREDKLGHQILDGSGFFSGMEDPEIEEPDKLEGLIWDAWKAFQKARTELNKKKTDLEALQAELKAAEKKLADLKSNFIKTIREKLAEWETDRVNPAA